MSSAVYIFHKGIISLVLCNYEVQMNMPVLGFERKCIFEKPVFQNVKDFEVGT